MTTEYRGPPLKVLMYHAVVEDPLPIFDWCFLPATEFRRQMEYLVEHHEVVPLGAVLDGSDEGATRTRVALTFDDGLASVSRVVLPLMRTLRLSFSVYLATRYIGAVERLWFCDVVRAFAQTTRSRLEWEGRSFGLSDPDARAAASAAIQASLKGRHPRDLLDGVGLLLRLLEVDPVDRWRDSPFQTLDAGEVAELVSSGLVEVGAHTQSHAILSRLTPAEQRSEIEGSVARVKELTGRPCELFAYPNGQADDYHRDSVELLRSSSIRAGVTTVHGENLAGQPLLELRRIGIGADIEFGEFVAMLSGSSR